VAPPATSPAATQVSAAAPTQTGQQEEPKVSASTEQKQIAPEIHVDQPAFSNDGAPQPQIPAPPPVVEQTGRCLTILENFDEETAQSREFSIYFNSKKPPRLTSTCTFSETLRLDDQADLFSRNLLVTLCYHISSFTFPGSRDLSPFCQRICISRNPTDCCPKVCVESHARLLCWSCRCCGARGASTIPQS
jgi:hypothetical protein